MRYVKRIPAANRELSEELIADGWRKLKEPSNLGMAMLLSIPFIIINGAIFIVYALYLYDPLKEFLYNINEGISISFNLNLSTLLYVAMIFVFMTVHEFIHASFIPNFLKSDKTCWGINGLCGFVYTTEEIKRGRFLVISIMPFILLSMVLPFILKVLGMLNGFVIFLGLVNAMGSCVDFLNMVIIVSQVPKGAVIVNNGFETYFKLILI